MNDTRADTAVTTNIARNQFESLHVRKTLVHGDFWKSVGQFDQCGLWF